MPDLRCPSQIDYSWPGQSSLAGSIKPSLINQAWPHQPWPCTTSLAMFYQSGHVPTVIGLDSGRRSLVSWFTDIWCDGHGRTGVTGAWPDWCDLPWYTWACLPGPPPWVHLCHAPLYTTGSCVSGLGVKVCYGLEKGRA